MIRLRSCLLALADACGLVTHERFLAMAGNAELALRAGIRPSLEEWDALSSVEQAAWVRAGDGVEIANGARLAIASQTPEGAVGLAAKVDPRIQVTFDEAKRKATRELAVDDFKRRWSTG